MENHPIPQDITGFQFKLIGNMTIKQFAYLAGGSVAGWIFYISPLFFLIKLPLAIFSIIMGVSLAFVPLEGRPLDTMVLNFFKAMFSPTQFVYEKSGGHLNAQIAKTKTKHKKNELPEHPVVKSQAATKEDEKKKELVYFSSLAHVYGGQPLQSSMNVAPTVSAPHSFDKAPTVQAQAPQQKNSINDDQIIKEKEMESKEQELQKELMLAKQQQASADPTLAKKAKEETLSLEEELRKTVGEKDKLEQQLLVLSRKLDEQKKTFYSPGTVEAAPKQSVNVRSVPQGLGNSVGLPITSDFPNIISGIVKDPRGNPLPNILVEVKDQDANPVRAFKTNGVGQFASATALTNGVYTIEFEDPKEENKFDAIQFEAKGEIILPIEIISVDKREELRRELFN